MQYVFIGGFFFVWGILTLVNIKKPSTKKDYVRLERRYTIIDRRKMILLDGCFYTVFGVLFILSGYFYNHQLKNNMIYILIPAIIIYIIYMILKRKLLKIKA